MSRNRQWIRLLGVVAACGGTSYAFLWYSKIIPNTYDSEHWIGGCVVAISGTLIAAVTHFWPTTVSISGASSVARARQSSP